MAEEWERSSGKTYLDTEQEQLAALETDETLHNTRNLLARSATCVIS